MPLKLNFKRTHRYNVSAKDLFVIPIYTLDSTCVEYTVSPTTTGRDALEYVAQRLDIEDVNYVFLMTVCRHASLAFGMRRGQTINGGYS